MGSLSERQPRTTIFQKAARLMILPSMIAASACAPSDIPDCTEGPQSLARTVVLNGREETRIDNVILSRGILGTNDKIRIRQTHQPQDHRASTFPDGHIEFTDTKNGRHYVISKDPSRSDERSVTTLIIQADCETTPK